MFNVINTVTDEGIKRQSLAVFVTSHVEPIPTKKYTFSDYNDAFEFATSFSDGECVVELCDGE